MARCHEKIIINYVFASISVNRYCADFCFLQRLKISANSLSWHVCMHPIRISFQCIHPNKQRRRKKEREKEKKQ